MLRSIVLAWIAYRRQASSKCAIYVRLASTCVCVVQYARRICRWHTGPSRATEWVGTLAPEPWIEFQKIKNIEELKVRARSDGHFPSCRTVVRVRLRQTACTTAAHGTKCCLLEFCSSKQHLVPNRCTQSSGGRRASWLSAVAQSGGHVRRRLAFCKLQAPLGGLTNSTRYRLRPGI